MFEFICDKVIPGCTHKETGDTPERVREKALQHLHEHHDMSYLDAQASLVGVIFETGDHHHGG